MLGLERELRLSVLTGLAAPLVVRRAERRQLAEDGARVPLTV
ncbi:hypothetical protein OG585_23000 [Streptomyces sp. NBC_01340]|nr:hypothetical protein OG585_23000 [Streptomyces sp. NBC_01340]